MLKEEAFNVRFMLSSKELVDQLSDVSIARAIQVCHHTTQECTSIKFI